MTIKQMQIISYKELVVTILDPGKEIFVIYITCLGLSSKMSIYQTWKAQIILLVAKKIIIPAKYLDFANIFLEKLAIELFKHSAINKYSINLEPSK